MGSVQTWVALTAFGCAQVMELVMFDEVRALKMLVASTDKMAVAHVLAQLKGQRRLMHTYLDMLFDKDPRAGANFHELQVELYADFDQVRLAGCLMLARRATRVPASAAAAARSTCRRLEQEPGPAKLC